MGDGSESRGYIPRPASKPQASSCREMQSASAHFVSAFFCLPSVIRSAVTP